jgi:hypothetical protein
LVPALIFYRSIEKAGFSLGKYTLLSQCINPLLLWEKEYKIRIIKFLAASTQFSTTFGNFKSFCPRLKIRDKLELIRTLNRQKFLPHSFLLALKSLKTNLQCLQMQVFGKRTFGSSS